MNRYGLSLSSSEYNFYHSSPGSSEKQTGEPISGISTLFSKYEIPADRLDDSAYYWNDISCISTVDSDAGEI